MADLATPSAADMSTIGAGADNIEKTRKSKPEKPDEVKYKSDLEIADQEHAAAQEKLVRLLSTPQLNISISIKTLYIC